MTKVRNRILVIVAVLVLSAWAIYPVEERIKLGLDLKGGVHLVLRVQTDDALRLETQTTVERLRDTLTRNSIRFTKLDVTNATEFIVEGVQDDAGFRGAAAEVGTVFDRSASGRAHVFRISRASRAESGRRRFSRPWKPLPASQRAGGRRAVRGADTARMTRSSCSSQASPTWRARNRLSSRRHNCG